MATESAMLEVINAQGEAIEKLKYRLAQTEAQLKQAQEALSLRARHHAVDRETLKDLRSLLDAATSVANQADTVDWTAELAMEPGARDLLLLRLQTFITAAVAVRNRAQGVEVPESG